MLIVYSFAIHDNQNGSHDIYTYTYLGNSLPFRFFISLDISACSELSFRSIMQKNEKRVHEYRYFIYSRKTSQLVNIIIHNHNYFNYNYINNYSYIRMFIIFAYTVFIYYFIYSCISIHILMTHIYSYLQI